MFHPPASQEFQIVEPGISLRSETEHQQQQQHPQQETSCHGDHGDVLHVVIHGYHGLGVERPVQWLRREEHKSKC